MATSVASKTLVEPATSAVSHAGYLATRHFPSLDGLRCLAILPVIWHHSTPRPLEGLLGRGPLGVDLFFAISGFLITTLLLRESASQGRISLSGFYVRRSLRIFPLYYAVLGLYLVWATWGLGHGPQRTHFFESLPWYFTYTSNWLVDFAVPHPVLFAFSWSLATEEQFYLIWPWILRASRRAWVPIAFMLFALALDQSADFGLLSEVLPSNGLPFRVLSSIAAPICLGALLAHGLHMPRAFRILRALLGSKLAAPVALAALVVLVALSEVQLLAVHLAMTALVGACCIRSDHGLAFLTDVRSLRYIGTISYGMYMLHISAITSVKALIPPAFQTTALVYVLSLGVAGVLAHLSYRFFEKPFLQLRGRFRPKAPNARG